MYSDWVCGYVPGSARHGQRRGCQEHHSLMEPLSSPLGLQDSGGVAGEGPLAHLLTLLVEIIQVSNTLYVVCLIP